MKSATAAALFAAAIAAAGCGSDTETAAASVSTTLPAASTTTSTPAPAAPTTSVAVATPPASAANLRAETCRDVLQMLDAFRELDPGGTEKRVQQTIDWMPTRPEWQTMSEVEREATIAGVRDAAAGSCS